jgi:hypothetical protein
MSVAEVQAGLADCREDLRLQFVASTKDGKLPGNQEFWKTWETQST